MTHDRLAQQLAFVLEMDRLKGIQRQTVLLDGSRRENTAEHSWHISLMALVLAEHADEVGVDVFRVVRMLLVHDLVEIDAGDTFCYDLEGMKEKERKEREAADRIFGLLPGDQGEELRALWHEFERRDTPESRLANALDRLQPVLSNLNSEGDAWRRHGISREQVIERNHIIGEASQQLWEHVRRLIDEAFADRARTAD